MHNISIPLQQQYIIVADNIKVMLKLLQLTWAEGIRGMMGEKGLKGEDCTDRSNWRRNII
jgi:hypothetical protein